MKDFVINQPLLDRSVYGIKEDDSRVLVGTITCVTPEEWVMYWSDAKWKFISRFEGIPSSDSGTMEQVEEFVMGLFAAQVKEAA